MKKEELIILWPFYLSSFLNMALISSYAIIYFMNLNFSFFQISILLALSTFVSVLFDIPTGAIADIYGRKFSVVLAYALLGIITILVPLSTNFYYVAVLFFMLGAVGTLRTGADEAWIISNIKNARKSMLMLHVENCPMN